MQVITSLSFQLDIDCFISRIRLPLVISGCFVLCHIFSVYLPTVEINVEVIEENRPEEEPEEEDEEYSIDSEDSETDLDLAVFVEIVGERGEGN